MQNRKVNIGYADKTDIDKTVTAESRDRHHQNEMCSPCFCYSFRILFYLWSLLERTYHVSFAVIYGYDIGLAVEDIFIPGAIVPDHVAADIRDLTRGLILLILRIGIRNGGRGGGRTRSRGRLYAAGLKNIGVL